MIDLHKVHIHLSSTQHGKTAQIFGSQDFDFSFNPLQSGAAFVCTCPLPSGAAFMCTYTRALGGCK